MTATADRFDEISIMELAGMQSDRTTIIRGPIDRPNIRIGFHVPRGRAEDIDCVLATLSRYDGRALIYSDGPAKCCQLLRELSVVFHDHPTFSNILRRTTTFSAANSEPHKREVLEHLAAFILRYVFATTALGMVCLHL